MHRSGTSMLTRLLEQAGLFVGIKKGPNHESRFFNEISRWLFAQANASWDNPYNARFLKNNLDDEIVNIVQKRLMSYHSIRYLGVSNYLKYHSVQALDIPFGWKNPINTFLIPVWKKIFPELTIIHIYRNPLSVTESLMTREIKRKAWHGKNKSGKMQFANADYHLSIRTLEAEECIQLWYEYVSTAFEYTHTENKILHVKYEDLLSQPIIFLQNILSFAELKYSADSLIKMISNIDTTKSDKKTSTTIDERKISDAVTTLMGKLNYSF